MEGLIEGRIVHYVLSNEGMTDQHRPAILVRVWKGRSDGSCNLTVFPDWSNDGSLYEKGLAWCTSIKYSVDPKPNTWHWPEKA